MHNLIALGSLGTFAKGRGLAKADLTAEGVPCLRYAEIYTKYGDVIRSLVSRTSEAGARASRALNYGDIVFAASGETPEEIGKAVAYIGTEGAVVGGDTVVLTGHGQDPIFLAHALNFEDVAKQKAALGKGHSVVHIHAPDLATLLLSIPSLPEQRRIGAVLDAWDSAIASAERLVEAKRTRFDWLRDEVLTGRKRLRGFNDVWCDVRLADVVLEHGLRATGNEEVFSVSVHKGLINQVEHLGRSFSAKDTGHYNRVIPGDIVYTKSPTGDFPLGIIKQSKVEKDVIVSPLYGVFTPSSVDLGIVLDAYFTSPKATEKYLTPLVQKGAKNTIAVTNTQFLQGALSVPRDDGEIVALAKLVAAAMAEIKAGNEELQRFRRQKRGLMQQLFKGGLDVPETIDLLFTPDPEMVATA